MESLANNSLFKGIKFVRIDVTGILHRIMSQPNGIEKIQEFYPDVPDITLIPLQDRYHESSVMLYHHSSGSVAVPKPVPLLNKNSLKMIPFEFDNKLLIFPPLFHSFGLMTTLVAVGRGDIVVSANMSRQFNPQEGLHLIENIKPDCVFLVPSMIQEMISLPKGEQVLSSIKTVISAGSGVPEDLGNLCVIKNINLIQLIGATEFGAIMISDFKDKNLWQYYRTHPNLEPFVKFLPNNKTNTYELIILKGAGNLNISNSVDPPESFHSRDLLEKHPTISGAWKYVCRIDDRITLINGEKVLPVPFEAIIRGHVDVRQCAMFGVGMEFPGIAIIPHQHVSNKQQFISDIWPTIQKANEQFEYFSHIARDMILVLSYDSKIPETDKGTIDRISFYSKFHKEIQEMYSIIYFGTILRPYILKDQGKVKVDVKNKEQLQDYLLTVFRELARLDLESVSQNFFDSGLNSIQVALVTGRIRRDLKLGGDQMSLIKLNMLYNYSTIEKLACYLFDLKDMTKNLKEKKDDITKVRDLITNHSFFKAHIPKTTQALDKETVLLTCVANNFGGEILYFLLQMPLVAKVYCVIRDDGPKSGMETIQEMFTRKNYSISPAMRSKIIIVQVDYKSSRLSLSHEARIELINSLTCLIHNYWPADFNLGIDNFECPIRVLQAIIQLCLQVRADHPVRLYFVSSIAVFNEAKSAAIPESVASDVTQILRNGYGYSIFVAENIIHNAALTTGMEARIIRFGQLIGPTGVPSWNENEYIPSMIKSSLLLGVLPDTSEEYTTWLPVDIAANCLLEVAGFKEQRQVAGQPLSSTFNKNIAFNILPKPVVKWKEVYSILDHIGFEFELVPKQKWLQIVSNSDPNTHKNPAIKLLDFFTCIFSTEETSKTYITSKTRSLSITLDTYNKFNGLDMFKRIAESWYADWSFSAKSIK